jgi:predicted GIY-YIG superfamily endonuclease
MQELIYVIFCTADETLPVYIGKTKNLKRRWREHKSVCINENSKDYNLPVYQFIRNNHGIEHWAIKELYACKDDDDGSILEEFYINDIGIDNLLNDVHGIKHADGICPHGKIRRECVECNGSSICIHNKQRKTCIECNGSSTCPHKKANKKQCKECYPWYCFACKIITSVGHRKRHLGSKKHIKNLLNLNTQN